MPRKKYNDDTFRDLTKEIDNKKFADSIKAAFADFPDPRQRGKVVYPIWYLLLVILSGYLAECDDIDALADFAIFRNDWLNDLAGEKFSPPSYDTLWWLLVRCHPDTFREFLRRWLAGLSLDLKNQVLALDGKRLKGASKRGKIVHLVELFAAENRLTVATKSVENKKTEPSVVENLLDDIDVQGALISMDALFAKRQIAKCVIDHRADYLIALKANQGLFHAEAVNFFEQAYAIGYEGVEHDCHLTEEKSHGRVEQRTVRVVHHLDWLPQASEWEELKSLIEVRSKRNGQSEIRYYFCSRLGSAKDFNRWIRSHWSVESLNWVLDVIFKEDNCLANTGYLAENQGILKRFATNIIKTIDPKRGFSAARRGCMYEPNYLKGLLGRLFVK
jgi:predicted transposase YbfD/YdcC